MFERFTERARHAVVLSQDEARRRKHHMIEPVHLLVGISREEEGIGAKALVEAGLLAAADAVTAIWPDGEAEVMQSQMPFTGGAKRVLEIALREALSLGHNYIGTEHVLLGLLRCEDRVVARVFQDCGVEPGSVRAAVLRLLGAEAPASSGRSAQVIVTVKQDRSVLERLDRIERVLGILP